MLQNVLFVKIFLRIIFQECGMITFKLNVWGKFPTHQLFPFYSASISTSIKTLVFLVSGVRLATDGQTEKQTTVTLHLCMVRDR